VREVQQHSIRLCTRARSIVEAGGVRVGRFAIKTDRAESGFSRKNGAFAPSREKSLFALKFRRVNRIDFYSDALKRRNSQLKRRIRHCLQGVEH